MNYQIRTSVFACAFGVLLAIAGLTVLDWRFWMLSVAFVIGMHWGRP